MDTFLQINYIHIMCGGEFLEQLKIREFGASIGIELMGFCDIDFSETLVNILKERRENNKLTGFEEQNENVRVDINAIMPTARTIISVALPYRTIELDTKRPHFSRASMGLDYHRVMRNKLQALGGFLYENYQADSIALCDTNPMVEREIAVKAGIGFQGKNNNIITDKYGSFIFLGELITNLFVDRDNPAVGSCGSCTLCIKACPSGALEQAYCLNGKRCLSFVTQKKEELTMEEIEKLGTRIYGCDTCQEVCPQNINKPLSKIKEFWPQEWNYNLGEKLFLMTNKEFKETYGSTSSGWRGKQILIRNMIIAMGNSKKAEYLKPLEKLKAEKFKSYSEIAIKKILEE